VNSAGFDAFVRKFQEFQKAGRTVMPTGPGGIGGGAMGQSKTAMQEQLTFADRLNRANRQLLRDWQGIRDASALVVRHVKEIGSTLLHMGALSGLIGGLATGFGFLGMDMLGRGTAGYRRSALGLGTSIGGMRAFGLDFGRFVDTGSVLGGVSAAMRDPMKRTALLSLGINPAEGEDAASVAVRTLERTQQLAKQTPESMLGTLLQSRRLGELGISLQDLTRLRNMSPEELRQQGAQFRTDVTNRGLNLTDDQAKKWQQFITTIDRARMTVETSFIRGLTPLAPALEKLSQAFSKTIQALLSKPELQQWIDNLAEGIKRFGDYVATPAFQKDVEDFATAVGRMAKALVSGVEWIAEKLGALGIGVGGNAGSKTGPAAPAAPLGRGVQPGAVPIPGTGSIFGNQQDTLMRNPDGTIVNPSTGALYRQLPGGEFQWLGTYAPAQRSSFMSPGLRGGIQPASFAVPMTDRTKEAHDYFTRLGYSEIATAGLLANIKGESGFNPAAFNPEGGGQGAQGIMQWRGPRIDQFRRMFGHDPSQGTFEEQLAFTQWELTHTEKGTAYALFGARTAAEAAKEVLRLYSRPDPMGQQPLGAQRGGWADQYYRNFTGVPSGPQKATNVIITVRNETGGNAITSIAQVA